MFPERIETPRLVLEPLTTDAVDLLEFHRHVSADDPAVHEELANLPWGPFETPKETMEWIRDAERRWEEGTRATYLIRADESMAETGATVGVTYLDLFWDRRSGEMVMWTREPFWGRGLLTEYAIALHDLAFRDLGVECMIAECFEDADRPRERFERYVEVFDGQYDGLLRNQVPVDGEVKNVHRFSITRRQYYDAMGYEAEFATDDRPAAEESDVQAQSAD